MNISDNFRACKKKNHFFLQNTIFFSINSLTLQNKERYHHYDETVRSRWQIKIRSPAGKEPRIHCIIVDTHVKHEYDEGSVDCHVATPTPRNDELKYLYYRKHLSIISKAKSFLRPFNGVLILVISIFLPPQVFASAFDVTAAGKAMFNPIISFIDAWYGTGIFAAGVGGAVVAAGDLRTRAMGFGIGSVVAGLTLLGVKAGFNVKIVMIGITNIIC